MGIESPSADIDAPAESGISTLATLVEHRRLPTVAPLAVGVLSVGASRLHSNGGALGKRLRQAGGPAKSDDETSFFVVRSNGQMSRGRQSGASSWFSHSSRIGGVRAEPGNTVLVPEEMDKTTFVQAANDRTQIVYQFGLGVAAFSAVSR